MHHPMSLRSPRTKARAALAVLLVGLSSAPLARADEPTAAPAAPAAVSDEEMAEARKQFQAGVNLLEDPDGAKYEEAYHAFRKAYELSQSPKVLGNVGFCAFHLERDGEAIDAWTAYLRDAPDVSDRERAQIQRDLGTLTSTVARVTVKVARPATSLVVVDTRLQTRGQAVENSYTMEGGEATFRLRPGRHSIKVRADGEDSIPFEVTIEPASQITHDFTFPEKKPDAPGVIIERRGSPSVAGPVVLGVLGVLAIGGGATAGILARNKTNDIEQACPNDLCPATFDLDGQRDGARTLATVADAAFIGGGVLVGGALLWYLLLPKGGGEKAPTKALTAPRRAAAWMPGAACTANGCAFQLQRGF